MEEIRLSTDEDHAAVVLRSDPLTPRADVASALQSVFSTTHTPTIGGVVLSGIGAIGDLDLKEGAPLGWAPPGTVSDELGLHVVCVGGADQGRTWTLTGSEMFIGREPTCEIAVSDQSVSRRHTRLSLQTNKLAVEDLGSTNGTLRNDRRLEGPEVLHTGDRIRIGNTVLQIVDSAPVRVGGDTDATAEIPAGTLRLCVVGGSGAGQTLPLGAGDMTVGSGPGVWCPIDDEFLSQAHFRLSLSADGQVGIQDLGSHNGTTIDGYPVEGHVPFAIGSIVRAGHHLFAVREARSSEAALGMVESGRHRYDRSARIRSYPQTPTVRVPTEPTEADKPSFPWPIVIAPMILAGVMAFVFKRPEALLFSLLTPVMAISSSVTNRRQTGRRNERDKLRYDTEVREMYETVNAAVQSQRAAAWKESPDACQIGDTAFGPDTRLWERRLKDEDTFDVRIGTAPVAANVKVQGRSDLAPPQIGDQPVTLSLEAAGVTSLAGDDEQVRSMARWIVAQLITLVSPTDLTIGALTQPDGAPDWSWLGWVPHARMSDSSGTRVGNDQQTVEARISELTAVLDDRQRLREEQRIDVFSPVMLTVIDQSREFRRTPGVLRLLEEGPQFGLIFLTLDSDTNRTPGEAGALIAFDRANPRVCRLEVAGSQPVDEILAEGVTSAWSNRVALSVAPIEAATDDPTAQIPTMVRFADLAEVDVDDDAATFASWAAGARSTGTIIGATAEGAFSIDIARDGPHAFIAGTTGSGKTELLLTFIAGLALNNRPEAMNIIVVDWKGGGDFVELGGLPHTVGMVTNLDGHLAKRALASLQAEVARRQNILKQLKEQGHISESNVGSVWDEQPEMAVQTAMGRLVIIVDEFAELAQSLPEFLSGLVRVARVGRALGIHLMLATQRPRGVISGDLSANVGLRLVLRTESGESHEVLESDHADHISRRTGGRGFVRYGDPPRLVEFQTARVAGRRPGAVVGLPPPIVDIVRWADLGYALPRPPKAADRPDADATDLRAIVDMTQRVAASLKIAPPPSPWLAPLPDQVLLTDIAAPADPNGTRLVAPFGLIDEPHQQSQRPVLFDLERHGHLAFAGSAGSGRTTALRAIAGSLATHVAPADCNIYGFDFGNGGLLQLSNLPHVGAIVRSNEPDRIARVLERLSDELSRRQTVLARVQAASIADQRALDPENALPHIVVLVDRWDSFTSQYALDTDAHQIILRLARDGLGVGMHIVMSGDRYLLGGRISGEFERKIMLPFSDRDDYRDGGLRPQDMPETIAAGRGFLADDGAEIQIAALGSDDSGPALRSDVQAIAAAVVGRPAKGLIRVEALPTSISLNDVWPSISAGDISSPLTALIGVGGDDLSPELIDFVEVGPGFTIAGPPGTGRSTALLSLARSVLAFGASVVAITPRTSPVSSLAADKMQLIDVDDLDATDLKARLSQGPTLLVIDDAHLLGADAGLLVRQVIDDLQTTKTFAFAVAGDIDKFSLHPVALAAKRSGSGILLSPRKLDRDMLSLSALPSTIVGRQPPGRAFLARRSSGREIQVVM